MKTLFILNDPPYGTERSYNALPLAGALAKRSDDELRVFLMGDAALCAKGGHAVPQAFYNINRMLHVVVLRECRSASAAVAWMRVVSPTASWSREPGEAPSTSSRRGRGGRTRSWSSDGRR